MYVLARKFPASPVVAIGSEGRQVYMGLSRPPPWPGLTVQLRCCRDAEGRMQVSLYNPPPEGAQDVGYRRASLVYSVVRQVF